MSKAAFAVGWQEARDKPTPNSGALQRPKFHLCTVIQSLSHNTLVRVEWGCWRNEVLLEQACVDDWFVELVNEGLELGRRPERL